MLRYPYRLLFRIAFRVHRTLFERPNDNPPGAFFTPAMLATFMFLIFRQRILG